MKETLEINIQRMKEDTAAVNKNDVSYITGISPSPFGGSKNAEYRRSIQMFEQIYKEQGLYFALAFLYDSQYDRKDILAIMEILNPSKGKISDILKKA